MSSKKKLHKNATKTEHPIRKDYEQWLIDMFIEERIKEAMKEGWSFAVFNCTTEGGDIIEDETKYKKIQIQLELYDYECYAKKHRLEILYMDMEYNKVKRAFVKQVALDFSKSE